MHHDDFAAICALKYAYFRHLDLKEFDQLAELFIPQATASYQDGRKSYDSRDAIMDFLSSSMSTPDLISMHHGHHPELRSLSEHAAEGTWYLTDRVILPKMDYEIVGTAFYADRYTRVDGHWRIAHTGYVRVYEEHRTHSTGALLRFTSRFDGAPA
jgi:hypothetical protein